MFITRASRHDKVDAEAFLESQGWAPGEGGSMFIAREGAVIGVIRIVEPEPGTLIFDDIVVHPGRQHEGIGGQLVQAAMNNKGGTIYTRADESFVPFLEELAFSRIDEDDVPDLVRDYYAAHDRTGPYLTAR